MSQAATLQHTTTRPAATATQPPRFTAECAYLLTAAVTGPGAIAAWMYNVPINHGILMGAAIVAAVTGCGYIVRTAEARVSHRLELMSADKQEAHDEGFAAGYVAGVAARSGEPPRLRSVT